MYMVISVVLGVIMGRTETVIVPVIKKFSVTTYHQLQFPLISINQIVSNESVMYMYIYLFIVVFIVYIAFTVENVGQDGKHD